MVKGHVEIHDLLASQHGDTDPDPKATSDTSSMEDTDEYRVMMAYAQRRRPKDKPTSEAQDSPSAVSGDGDANRTTPPQVRPEEEATEKKKKKKKKKTSLKLWRFFKCVNPQTDDKEPPQNDVQPPQNDVDEKHNVLHRCFDPVDEEKKEEEKMAEVAMRLAELADEIKFAPPEWETDSPDDDIEKAIALLLRESGDKLHEKELINNKIALELFWDYNFFRSLIHRLLSKMGLRSSNPDSPGPHASPKTQIAVTCEVTSRLSAINTLPMSCLLNHGARYLQEYYSPWVQEQGGYEAAFESDEDEVE